MRFQHLLSILVLPFALAFAGAAAHAQDKVSARSSQNDGYSRLVVEWPQPTASTVSKEGNRILIRFAKAGAFSYEGGEGANIRDVRTASGKTAPLQLAVTIPKGSKFRDFAIGPKFIVDVYDPADEAAAIKKPEPKPEQKPEQKPKTEETSVQAGPETVKPDAVQPAAAATEPKAVDAQSTPETIEQPVPEPAPELQKPLPDKQVLSLTGTTPFGLAAYEKAGYLWLVTDASQSVIEDKVTQGNMTPEAFSAGTGQGWKIKIPEGAGAAVTGGGLAWSVTLDAKEKIPSRQGNVRHDMRDGKDVLWPLKGMRKSIAFNDPFTGENITVVTAPDAAQSIAGERNFVDFKVLDSLAGFIYVPKSDGVASDITTTGIVIAKPDGLAVSARKDMQAPQIREDVAPPPEQHAAQEEAPTAVPADAAAEHKKETAPSTATPIEGASADAHTEPQADHPAPSQSAGPDNVSSSALEKSVGEKPQGNNIYNFSRWEMGGLPALEENQHVMMVEIAQKAGDERVADIITLAKILLANNRGAEVLGLLRIAEMQVPALEDNREFMALRAAAMALTSKYDEAFDDYSKDNLKNYDDVRYWRAYTLAGLEDWRQAGEVLPADIAPVKAYPKAIRVPMLLSFAEIALRSGKIAIANDILDTLKPEVDKLALPYASSWTYLKGEAERQEGDAKAAEELWTPLVKNGKDDLFRAKAGLSLTKLELDEKKIKPADAIDRLEGLRYAWRGDELETLVNYRLGQMYVDNKQYLKGLTVLRNASTLMPDTDISRVATSALQSTFKDVFAGDAIKNISPLEAISIHEEFKDLIPKGPEGDAYVETLAERLVDADLLGRAASLLDAQVASRLQGDKKAEIAIRSAAVKLLDGNPDGALRSLDIAQDTLDKIGGTSQPPAASKPEEVQPQAGEATPPAQGQTAPAVVQSPAHETRDPEKQRQIHLLRARALSMKKQPQEAMAILDAMEPDADVNRLRADISWTAGDWAEAAIALGDLITAEDVSARRPLNDSQSGLIFNRGIALNLANDRVALANLRERYNAQMKETAKGAMFEVVTRPRRPDMVGSPEAIDSMMSEIDLFQGFLDGYAKMGAPEKKEAAPALSINTAETAEKLKDDKKDAAAKAAESAPKAEEKKSEKEAEPVKAD